jgi:heat-inducible transcriptional repressor
VEINERQRFLLEKVVQAHVALGQPVGSKWISEQPDVPWGPSTVRAELARLEEIGLLRHPHTSAGREPTDRGYRAYVDRMLEGGNLPAAPAAVQVEVSRREVDDAMRTATEQLSQVTNLLAIVTAPPIATSTIKHIELLALQPQLAMIVVITSTGGVTKRLIPSERPLDPGLVDWARSYLNEELGGMSVGARMINSKLLDPSLGPAERAFMATLLPTFTELEERAGDTLYVDGAARLLSEDRMQELSQLGDLMLMLEHRVALLAILQRALEEPRMFLRIGQENERDEMKSVSIVASGYGPGGPGARHLGAVSVIGPVRMDYGHAITSVRAAAAELSRVVAELYE